MADPDLVVELAAVREAASQVRAAADACAPVAPALRAVSTGVPGGELAAAADDLDAWALEVQALCARVVRHAAAAVRSCEELVAVERGLCR